MSGSQKFINVISILNIVFGAIGVILSILGIIGIGSVDYAAALAQSGVDVQRGLSMSYAGMVVLMISSLFELILGILGVRAARDAMKIGPVFVVAVIDMVLTLAGIILSVIAGNFQWSRIFSLVLPLLVLYAANNIRNQKNAMLGR